MYKTFKITRTLMQEKQLDLKLIEMLNTPVPKIRR